MTFELRPTTDEEFPVFARQLEDAFGFHFDEANIDEFRSTTEIERTIAACDGDQIVGTAGAYSFELTVPGGVQVDAAGVTIVTVRSTHRRRGILRSMMAHQLDDVAQRGEPIAILTASESLIYGRFGYGLATLGASWKIDTDHAQLAHASRSDGRIRMSDAAEIGEHAPRLYDVRRTEIPGAVTRSDAWWKVWLKDRPFERDGASARWYVVHENGHGQIDGFLAYRRVRKWAAGVAQDELRADQLYGVDDDVEAALWQYMFDHDLVGTVSASSRPVDEPMRWRLADPRRIVTTEVTDKLWLRILDVPAALSSRHYGTDDRLVIEVDDRFRPETSDRYLLEGAPNGAACTRTDAEPDLTMDIADLGAIYLGGVTATALRRAGRITEQRPDAAARADTLFLSTPAPWMTTGF